MEAEKKIYVIAVTVYTHGNEKVSNADQKHKRLHVVNAAKNPNDECG